MPSSRWQLRLLNLYPPYLGAGVRVWPSADLRTFEVRLVNGGKRRLSYTSRSPPIRL